MEDFIARIKAQAKKDPKRIVYPESTEERTLKALQIIIKEKTAKPILIGNPAEVQKAIKKLKLNLKGVPIIDHLAPENAKKLERYANDLYNLRKDKGMDLATAQKLIREPIYYGTMMVHLNEADGLISGAIHTTGHTLLPALQIIKTREKFHKVSGVFFIRFKDEVMLFADAAVTPDPDAHDLAEIAIDTARTAVRFGIEPRIAMLSFSTKGSANHPLAKKMIEATEIARDKAKKMLPEAVIDGEMQLDAAVEPWVAKIKCPKALIQGDANVLIFPDLQAANIGYKLATFFGHAEAIGPILQGLRKPVNDLSRGCFVKDIVDITAMTVIEAHHIEKGAKE